MCQLNFFVLFEVFIYQMNLFLYSMKTSENRKAVEKGCIQKEQVEISISKQSESLFSFFTFKYLN